MVVSLVKTACFQTAFTGVTFRQWPNLYACFRIRFYPPFAYLRPEKERSFPASSSSKAFSRISLMGSPVR